MTFKRMLRFAFAFPLLAAALNANAQQEVKLNDGTFKSWAEFASAINNPASITGTADRTTLTSAEKELTRLQDVAQEKANALKSAQDTYNAKEALLKNWQDENSNLSALLQTYQATLSKYSAEKDKLKETRQDLLNDSARYQSELNDEKKNFDLVTAGWLTTINANAQNFMTLWNGGTDGGKVFYKETRTGFGGKSVTLTLAFTNEAPEATGWNEFTTLGLYNYLQLDNTPSKTVNTLNIYLGSAYKAIAGSDEKLVSAYQGNSQYVLSLAVSAINDLTLQDVYKEKQLANPTRIQELEGLLSTVKGKIKSFTQQIKDKNDLIDGVNSSIESANNTIETNTTKINDYIKPVGSSTTSVQADLVAAIQAAQVLKDKADADVVAQEKVVDAELKKYNDAIAANAATTLAQYKNVTIVADVTANDVIANYDGVINGGGHVINLGAANAVFTSFTGTLAEAAVNGKFAVSQVGAKFTKVAAWNGTGSYYNDEGVRTANIQNIGELGYIARNQFGVDFNAGQLVANSVENSKVYKLTVYETNNTTTTEYVINNGGALRNGDGAFALKENRFAKSETEDLKGIANVFYGVNNTCDNVVITDKKSFFAPFDIDAKNVSYNRTYKAGMNAVCLPFNLSKELNTNIEYISTYDKETTDKFWFKKVAGEIPAYSPILMGTFGEVSFNNLANIIIKATPPSQIVVDEGDGEDPSKSYGLLKEATREQFKGGASESFRIYGLNGDKFQRASETATISAFRIVLYSADVTGPAKVRAKSLGLDTDEKGIGFTGEDATTEVENIATDATAVTVVGGQNEIIFNSEADYTKVGVYSIDGRLAATADVKAGTTSVNVPSGLYIVMGKKVLVK